MQLGFKLIAEAYGPRELVRQAVAAEAAGFDFIEISDHFHPWLGDDDHGHSPFAFSVLGAIAAKTERLGLATGVTCPSFRYHPAIVAQAAATLGVLSEGRFTLGIGSGERLNEHIIGEGWPEVRVRHERLREALEIICELWEGGYRTYRGKHFNLDTARVFDLPDEPPVLAVAMSGERSAKIAAELGTGMFATEPKAELTQLYADAGGRGPRYVEVPLAYAPTEDEGAESARRRFRFGTLGWKVLPELPNPENFVAATASVTADDMREEFGCGADVERQVEVAKQFVDAGFDHLALVNAGPPEHMDAFFEHVATDLGPRLRELGSAS
ncbi:MAG: Luciferase-like monooxygenase [Thermoleophilia bacterium]|nr:Luciferase-like monooxygenase [Thermoleophilia bacterium]